MLSIINIRHCLILLTLGETNSVITFPSINLFGELFKCWVIASFVFEVLNRNFLWLTCELVFVDDC